MLDYNDLEIKTITLNEAKIFISKYHYRQNLPRITKICYGGFINNKLVAVITLGYGTQPKNTIKKIFPPLNVCDYLEIGRLCLIDDLPKNSESYFISKVIKLLKNNTNIKILFSWSDGIMGKAGYVYQASNFYYIGKIKTDVYITKEGYLIHPRSAKKLLEINASYVNKNKLFWLTDNFLKLNNIKRLKGYQYKYLLFLCNHKIKKQLIKQIKILPFPKNKDNKFFIKNYKTNKYEETNFPHYIKTLNAEEISRAIYCVSNTKGLVQFQHSA